jgi:hypothetical protein
VRLTATEEDAIERYRVRVSELAGVDLAWGRIAASLLMRGLAVAAAELTDAQRIDPHRSDAIRIASHREDLASGSEREGDAVRSDADPDGRAVRAHADRRPRAPRERQP